MARFRAFGPSNQLLSPNWDNEQSINIATELMAAGAPKTAKGAFRTPGRTVFANLPLEGKVPCMFTVNGRFFSAATSFYELNAAGAIVATYGALNGAPVTPCQMCANQGQILILSNGSLYLFTLATNTFAAVNMGQFNGPVLQIDFCDGYFLAAIQNSNTFQQSNLEDGSTWSGLNIATISLFPDNITSFKVNSGPRQPTFFSGKKSVAYTNSGAGFPVFVPVPSGEFANGAGPTFATVEADNTLFWIDLNEHGGLIARRLNGTIGERVSTHAQELRWQNYATALDAVAYVYQEYGHTFWCIYFPTANETWCYDISTGEWHQRGRWKTASGTYEAEHAMCHVYVFQKHLVGDWATGNIYWQSMNFNTDNGYAIRWYRLTPTTSKENEWLYYDEFRADVDTGQVPTALDITLWTAVYGSAPLVGGNGQRRNPQIVLRWSNNNGKNWSNEHLLDCRAGGEYGRLIRKVMLGRGRNRVWELSGTDPVPWLFADCYVNASPDLQPKRRLADEAADVA